MRPFPLFFSHAVGSKKHTVDGLSLVDYCMGHGSLLLGHNHELITRAIHEQLERGTHFAAPCRAELELATLIVDLVPSAERVRFAGTGSEACALALRVARGATGKHKFVRFEGHYHGWHDEFFWGLVPPYDGALGHGIPGETFANQIVLPPADLSVVEKTLRAHADIAAVFVEPAGGGHGTQPTSPEWVAGLRELTRKHGVVLVFDEMVSGFRLTPGGYQQWSGVTPDLTTLGKALFGGMPGGALAGRADLMDVLSVGHSRFVAHNGSWNAFPVACAAGVAVLQRLRSGDVHKRINDYASRLRLALAEVIDAASARMHVYGMGSHVHFLFDHWPFSTPRIEPGKHGLLARDPNVFRLFRLAMFNEGIDFSFGNNVSAVHSQDDFDATIAGFQRALTALVETGVVATESQRAASDDC